MLCNRIFLPLEFYQREFLTKLYLALVASRNGFDVVIGDSNQSVFWKAKNSFVLLKDMYAGNRSILLNATKQKMNVSVMDEEGLILDEIDYISSIRVDDISMYDTIFCWGNNHKELIEKAIGENERIELVGSLKFDLCELMRQKFSNNGVIDRQKKVRRILINTRFSYTNGLTGSVEDELKALRVSGCYLGSEGKERFDKLIDAEYKIFDEFIFFIKHLMEDASFVVTIRPHPAERLEVYESLATHSNNITVDRNTDLREQILSHDCLVHDGCTTAIEAKAMMKPVFGLRPVISNYAYNDYANQYSVNFSSEKKLFQYIKNVPINDFTDPEVDAIALQGIYNWMGNNELSAKAIINKYKEYKAAPCFCKVEPRIGIRDVIKNFLYKSVSWFDDICNGWIVDKSRFLKKFIVGMDVVNQKFPDIKFQDVKNQIKILCEMDPTLGHHKDYNLKAIGKKALYISLK